MQQERGRERNLKETANLESSPSSECDKGDEGASFQRGSVAGDDGSVGRSGSRRTSTVTSEDVSAVGGLSSTDKTGVERNSRDHWVGLGERLIDGETSVTDSTGLDEGGENGHCEKRVHRQNGFRSANISSLTGERRLVLGNHVASIVNLDEREVSLSSPSSSILSIDVKRGPRIFGESLNSAPSHLQRAQCLLSRADAREGGSEWKTYVLHGDVISTGE